MPNSREKKDQALFNKIAANYARKDTVRSTMLARRYQLFYALKPLLVDGGALDTIIEVACGVGAPAKYLLEHYERYIGIDYSENLIDAAREFNRNNPKATFIAGNARDIVIPGIKADLILAVGALHHMTEPVAVLRNLRVMAKPGAHFIALEPQRGNLIAQLMRWFRGKIDRTYSDEQVYFTKGEMIRLLQAAGLTDIEIRFQGYATPPFAQVIVSPQWLTSFLSNTAIAADKILDKALPSPLKILSWNMAIKGRFRG